MSAASSNSSSPPTTPSVIVRRSRKIRVFKTTEFARFARKSSISDQSLCEALAGMARGMIDANLGSGVYKQRLARRGEGKSGGFRTIVLLRFEFAAFFVHGFAKKDIGNIETEDLNRFKALAKVLLHQTEANLDEAVKNGKLVEVHCARQEISKQDRQVRS